MSAQSGEVSRLAFRLLVFFGPGILLFIIGGLTSIDVPGPYMDAVNPDYIVPRLLNPAAAEMPAWVIPGTLLFGKLPTIIAIYHGALPYYLGLPVYALFSAPASKESGSPTSVSG